MSHTIRTTLRPDIEITVSDAEYENLLELGLIYDGVPPDPVADPFDARMAERLADAGSTSRAVLGSTLGTSAAGVYVPPGWGQFWRAKRDAAGSGKAVIGVLGDSISHGFFTSSLRNKAWAHLMRAELQAAHGDGGVGFLSVADTDLINSGAQYAGYKTSNEWVALTGTWTNPGINEGPGSKVIKSPDAGGTATWQNVRGTSVSVLWLGQSGLGTFTWTIDGVAQTPVNTTAANGFYRTTVTGLSAGNHTVVITAPANVYLSGVAGENSTGVVLNMFGQAGQDSGVYISGSSTWGANVPWSGGANYPCDLLIYALGPNDSTSVRLGDAFAQNVRRAMDDIKDVAARQGAVDVLFVLPMAARSWDSNRLMHEYALRLRGLAAHYGAAFVDLSTLYRNSWDYAKSLNVWSTGSGNSGGPGNDPVHPGDAGAADYWSKIKTAVPGILA